MYFHNVVGTGSYITSTTNMYNKYRFHVRRGGCGGRHGGFRNNPGRLVVGVFEGRPQFRQFHGRTRVQILQHPPLGVIIVGGAGVLGPFYPHLQLVHFVPKRVQRRVALVVDSFPRSLSKKRLDPTRHCIQA